MVAGNFLLCFAILVAGGSATKVFQIFSHMGLSCVSLKTFFLHQKVRYSSSIFASLTEIQYINKKVPVFQVHMPLALLPP